MSDKYMPNMEPIRWPREYFCPMDENGWVELSSECGDDCRQTERGYFILGPHKGDPEPVLVSSPVIEFKSMWQIEGIPKHKRRKELRSQFPLSNNTTVYEDNVIYIQPSQRKYLGIPEGEESILSLLVGKNICISKYDGPVFYFGKN